MNIADKLIIGLIVSGHTEVDSKSKYRTFTHPKLGENKIFVGSHGALRKGPAASFSWSLGDATRQTAVYKNLLVLADQAAAQLQQQPTTES